MKYRTRFSPFAAFTALVAPLGLSLTIATTANAGSAMSKQALVQHFGPGAPSEPSVSRKTKVSQNHKTKISRLTGAGIFSKHMAEKHVELGGADNGFYVGSFGAKLPRRVDPDKDGTRYAKKFRKVFPSKKQFRSNAKAPGSLSESQFLQLIEESVPTNILRDIDEVVKATEALSRNGGAATLPEQDIQKLRVALIYSYAHSRDIETVLGALGYPTKTTNVHDMFEYAKGKHIKSLMGKARPAWFQKWAAGLDDEQDVNIGFMNPYLLGGLWQWAPTRDADSTPMDVHRLSDHHLGVSDDDVDPVETAVNNIFHGREHRYGVRKERSAPWFDLGARLASAETAMHMKNGYMVREITKDATKLIKALEAEGRVTPWYMVDTKSW